MGKRLAAARGLLIAGLCLGGLSAGSGLADVTGPLGRELDAPYEVTHVDVIRTMLTAAGVTAQDTVFDLGCGDGRIVIFAAREFGARGVGVDLDPQRIREARDNAAHEGVAYRTEFRLENVLVTDLRPATVVTLYMGDVFNILIRAKLFRELAPGTRVAAHAFGMGDWEPDRVLPHPKARNRVAYLWIIPAPVGGVWRWTARAGNQEVPVSCALTQQFQVVQGTMNVADAPPACLTRAALAGKELTLAAKVARGGREITILCRGTVEGDVIQGVQQWQDGPEPGPSPWTARRDPVDLSGRWEVRPASRKDFQGTLAINPGSGGQGSTYVLADGGKELPLAALYLWGSSVRFEVPVQAKPVVFTGVLEGEAGQGVFGNEGWPVQPAWSAKRVGDRKTAPALMAAATPAPASKAASSAPGLPSGATPPAPGAPPAPGQQAAPSAQAPAPTVADLPPALPKPAQARRWSPSMGEPEAGDEYLNAKDGSVLVWIPGGTFLMGGDANNDEEPVHQVKVDGFWLGKFEVMNRQYAKFLAERPREAEVPFLWDNPNYTQPDQPVVGVTMLSAAAYCRWAGLELPTEVQWEYAAAGGRQLKYPTATGEISHDLANIHGTGGRDQWEYTSPVGIFPPNPFGLYDMAGNAWEWTRSKFAPYPYSPADGREDPAGEKSGGKDERVLRGGCWYFSGDYCRTAYRHRYQPHLRYEYSGIRVMMPEAGK